MNGKNFEKIVVVGDSPDDIELASVAKNSVSYLYAHPWKKFRGDKADYKINDLREVLKELQKFQTPLINFPRMNPDKSSEIVH